MMRALAFVLILAFALAAYWASEHGAPNEGLPMVNASMPIRATQPFLFAPCPLGPRNLRLYEERKA